MIKTTPKSKRVLIWVFQSHLYLNKQFEYMLQPGSHTEYDSSKVGKIRSQIPGLPPSTAKMISIFDFVTVHQNADLSIRFYETMDYGASRNPQLEVKHKLSLYPDTSAGTVYFVVPIADNPRLPTCPSGEKD